MRTPIMTLIVKQIKTPTYQKHSMKKNSFIYFELCKIKLMKHGIDSYSKVSNTNYYACITNE
jgi:hypothetical protein